MKLKPIVNQIARYLPFFTDYFSDSEVIRNADKVPIPPGQFSAYIRVQNFTEFRVGQYVFIKDLVGYIPIVSVTLVNTNQLIVHTATDHKLNTTFDFKLQEGLDRIQHPNAYFYFYEEERYNGAFQIIDVPNRNYFTIQLPFTPTTPPVGRIGRLLQHATNYYEGYHKITTVEYPDAFYYPIDASAPVNTNNSGTCVTNLRISASIDIDRFLQSYTKQAINKYWLVVCPDRIRVSKDRRIPNDSLTVNHYGQNFRQLTIEPFYIYIVIPVSHQLSAREAYDSLYDIRLALFKSLLLYDPETDLSSDNNYLIYFLCHCNVPEWCVQCVIECVLEGDYIIGEE